jgi:parvulin-like peptidyl-prolyl isomerase
MRDLWDFVVKNKEMLTWIGGGIAAIAGAVWTIIAHFLPARESKSKNGAGMSVMQSGTGIASGRDTVISGGEINIGLDATRVGEQVALAQKPLIEQFERLVAEVSRDKGVPVAPLRTILLKLGEAGFPEETIPRRLDERLCRHLTPQSVVNDVLDRKIAGKEISVPLIKREIDKAKASRTGQELEAANLTTKKAADESEAPPTVTALAEMEKTPVASPTRPPIRIPLKKSEISLTGAG